MGTAKYLLGKLGQLFIPLLLVLSLAFLLFRVWQPGDPVATWAKATGSHFSSAQLDQIRHEWGLDVPLPEQHVHYMGQMLTFNFGTSTILNPDVSVSSLFWSRMAKSAILIVTSTFAAIAIGVLLGIYGGWKRQGKVDQASMGSSMGVYAMRSFVLGMILILLFAGPLHLFPVSLYESRVPKTGLAPRT